MTYDLHGLNRRYDRRTGQPVPEPVRNVLHRMRREPHGWECLCPRCEAATERLLCDVFPETAGPDGCPDCGSLTCDCADVEDWMGAPRGSIRITPVGVLWGERPDWRMPSLEPRGSLADIPLRERLAVGLVVALAVGTALLALWMLAYGHWMLQQVAR